MPHQNVLKTTTKQPTSLAEETQINKQLATVLTECRKNQREYH